LSADEKKTLKVNAPKDVEGEETTGKDIMDLIGRDCNIGANSEEHLRKHNEFTKGKIMTRDIKHGDIHRKEHHFIVKAWLDKDDKINFDLDMENVEVFYPTPVFNMGTGEWVKLDNEKIMAIDTRMLQLLQERLSINNGN
jgi:hypothetical protein